MPSLSDRLRKSRKRIVMDFDDLCDATRDKLEWVAKLKEAMPEAQVTLFTIPARTSAATIAEAKSLGPWVALGMHGWEHTLGECWTWGKDDALDRMQRAFDMGIDGKTFRAPKWIIDADTYFAAKELGWVIADHRDWRILGTGCRAYTYNAFLQTPQFTRVHGHLPDVTGNGIIKSFRSFVFDKSAQFANLFDAAEVS